jgi:hypothetical protein
MLKQEGQGDEGNFISGGNFETEEIQAGRVGERLATRSRIGQVAVDEL